MEIYLWCLQIFFSWISNSQNTNTKINKNRVPDESLNVEKFDWWISVRTKYEPIFSKELRHKVFQYNPYHHVGWQSWTSLWPIRLNSTLICKFCDDQGPRNMEHLLQNWYTLNAMCDLNIVRLTQIWLGRYMQCDLKQDLWFDSSIHYQSGSVSK
jgi:hypothetical protein